MLTQEKLKSVVTYNPETGIFIREPCSNNSFKRVVTGSKDVAGYLLITINKYPYKAHRLAWLYVYGNFPTGALDHINGIKSDNRISNLRMCTKKQNGHNRALNKNNTTGYRGVTFVKITKRYEARIKIDGKLKALGTYATAKEAGDAYIEYAKIIHGEFFCDRLLN
jgi:hypothetical protein